MTLSTRFDTAGRDGGSSGFGIPDGLFPTAVFVSSDSCFTLAHWSVLSLG